MKVKAICDFTPCSTYGKQGVENFFGILQGYDTHDSSFCFFCDVPGKLTCIVFNVSVSIKNLELMAAFLRSVYLELFLI